MSPALESAWTPTIPLATSARSATTTADRNRVFSLSNARDLPETSPSSTSKTSMAAASTPMRMTFSSDSSLRRNGRSPSYALPPLRSIVAINGNMADGDRRSPIASTSSRVERRASLNDGSAAFSSTPSHEPSSDRLMKKPLNILEKISSSSLALAQYAEEAQNSFVGPASLPDQLEKMQILATEVNMFMRDLRFQVEDNILRNSNNSNQRFMDSTFDEIHRRRRSSGATSTGSSLLGNGVQNNTRWDSIGLWDPPSAPIGKHADTRRTSLSSILSQQAPPVLPPLQQEQANGQVGHAVGHASEDQASIYPSTGSQYSRSHESQETQIEPPHKASPSSLTNDVASQATDQNRPHKYRKRSRAPAPGSCLSCGVEDTPEWRRGPGGSRTLCNACGLHYSKMVRKRKSENSIGNMSLDGIGVLDDKKVNVDANVTIEELRASVLVPSSGSSNSISDSLSGKIASRKNSV